MKMIFRTKVLWFIVLIFCLLLGASQAGGVSAEPDEWLAEENDGILPAVEPVSGQIPIAVTSANERKPVVAHGGDHYIVVYIREGTIRANVRSNSGHFIKDFVIDSSFTNFDAPSIAYHEPSELFIVAYHRIQVGGSYVVRVRAVSPTETMGSFFISSMTGFDIKNPAVACNQDGNSCLVAFDFHEGSLFYNGGRYMTLDKEHGITSQGAIRYISNLGGKQPYLAYGKGTYNYLLTYTRTIAGVEYPFYNHVSVTDYPNPYLTYSTSILSNWSDLPNHKYATGVAYDPCTERFIVLFDNDYSGDGTVVNVWMAAIHKYNAIMDWYGHIANNYSHNESSGGISFVTDDHVPAACGVMNKLVVTYTNWNTYRIYAVEVRGNDSSHTPIYDRAPNGFHFVVAQITDAAPNWKPAISSSASNGEMFIVYGIWHYDQDPSIRDIWGRLVHVWEAEPIAADFTASPRSGNAPLTINFSNQSEGDYTTCAWVFGDGGSSSQCSNPSHTYTAVGNYTVSLTVSGPGGTDTETKTGYIQVTAESSAEHKNFLPLIQR